MNAIPADELPVARDRQPEAVPDAGGPVIELRNVNKVYGNSVEALRNINLRVKRGEFVSLLGPSGCGKSTALKIIAGLSEASTGNVLLWGKRHKALGKDLESLCFVFQEPTLMPWARVTGNIQLPLDLRRENREKRDAKVAEAMALVDLEGFENAYPRQLSGGMRMRVSIARALVTDPRLCLMDEPFGALDEMTRNRLNDDLLRLWHKQHWTTVFVTHSVYEAVYLSTRIVVMGARPGRLVEEIPIEADYPRGNRFRHSNAYVEYCRKVSNALERAAAH